MHAQQKNRKIQVLISDPIHQDGIELIKEAGFQVDVKPTISKDQLLEIISDYNALIVRSRTKVTREIIEAGKKLKVIGRAGTGLDNIDLQAAKEREITVLNTPEAPADAVAELTLWLILSLARKGSLGERALKEGRWIKKELYGWQFKGKTLGLIGLGHIGERVARLAKAFGANLLITKRTPPQPELLRELEAKYISPNDFSKLLKNSDVISIHVPLTPQTRNMIDIKEINQMKDGAFLVNTSRGGIINEKALIVALQSGKLGGAAMDVYEVEPPQNLDLINLPNVVCTPHIGSQTFESQKIASEIIAKKLIETFN